MRLSPDGAWGEEANLKGLSLLTIDSEAAREPSLYVASHRVATAINRLPLRMARDLFTLGHDQEGLGDRWLRGGASVGRS
jgi:hypothetical protein